MEEQNNIEAVEEVKEKSLHEMLLEIEDQKDSIVKIDMSTPIEFCKRVKETTTTKRLSVIEDVENLFEQSLLNLERMRAFSKEYDNLMSAFLKMRSDVEFDYFSFNSIEKSVSNE